MKPLLSWRARTVLIAFVYAVYFGIAIWGAVLSRGLDTVYDSLIIAVVLPVMHLATTSMDMLWGERPALSKSVATLVLFSDWGSTFALGLACAVVSRTHVEADKEVALVANILSVLAQVVCAFKTREFLSSDKYDQATGESLDF
jgi:hypothetical protein